jgi:hypothetical protein
MLFVIVERVEQPSKKIMKGQCLAKIWHPAGVLFIELFLAHGPMAIHAFMIFSGLSIRFSMTESHDSRQLDTMRTGKRNSQDDEILAGLVCEIVFDQDDDGNGNGNGNVVNGMEGRVRQRRRSRQQSRIECEVS